MQLLKQSTASTVYVGPVLDSTGAAVTTAVVGDFRLIKNGTAATLSGATVTHDANGYYTIALTTSNTDTTGRLTIAVGNTAQSMSTHRYSVLLPSVYDALITNATNATGGLPTATGAISALSGAISTYAGGDTSGVTTLLTRLPSAISLNSGAVTVGTNNDKTGYSLASGGLASVTSWSVAITGNITGNLSGSVGSVTSGVTVLTNNDKTGYSLTQAFPSNFASLGINASGHVSRVTLVDTTTTNTDMRGTDSAALASNWTATRAGYLDGVLLASNYNQRIVSITGSNHIAADVHEFQPAVITAGDFAAGAIDANALAADAATEIATAVAATQALSRLDSMIESDGAGQFRFDTIALSMAPAGGGGGGTDWTANERTAIRSILGFDSSGTVSLPTVGVMDAIKDKTDLITTGTIASSIPVTASGQIDGPLVIGDDYLSANGRAFIWTVALPSAFVIATSTCKFGMQYEDEDGTYSFNVTGTVADAGSGNVTLTFDVPRTTTGVLGPGWYRWSVEIASASGTEVTRVKSSHNKLVEWVEKQT
jgi:hypothetical protein